MPLADTLAALQAATTAEAVARAAQVWILERLGDGVLQLAEPGATPTASDDVLVMPIDGLRGPLGALVVRFGNPVRRTGEAIERLDVLCEVAALVGLALDRFGGAGAETPTSQAEARHAELGRFAAAVNHDFNNLLAVAQGRAELLQAHADPEVRAHAHTIVAVGERAARLTRQLQAFARDQPLFTGPVELGPICEEALRIYRSVEGSAAVMLSVSDGLAPVEIEPAAVKHLIVNLLQNAGESAGRSGRVFVEVGRDIVPEAPTRRWPRSRGPLGWVRVRVSDTGPGFSREARQRLFEPFYTTKGVGRGLGLAAVARIVEGLAGVVDVPARPGRGAVVDVYLPVAAPPSRVHTVVVDPSIAGSERVWVVDDDVAVLDVLSMALESFGYDVRRFGDPADVLDAVEQGLPPDLLVSDLLMPTMDGVELYRALRRRGNGCPVLFVSGYATSGVDVPHERGTDFVAKPVAARVLAEKTRRLLNRAAG